MHIPSPMIWKEMLAVPQLVRFTYPFQDGDTRYPTLIIKAHSLLLKYILQNVPLTISFFQTSDLRCGYALHIADDPADGVFLWSLLADKDESAAIADLSTHGGCSIYLFNEACANCAWTCATITVDSSVKAIVDASPSGDPDPAQYTKQIDRILSRIRASDYTEMSYSVSPTSTWKPLHSTFIMNGVRSSSLNLLFDNEGSYQEQLAHAILGDLSPIGAFLNTQLLERSGNKEFADLVLTHEFGTIILESKTLSVFDQRETLPSRRRLEKNVLKSAKKALSQLNGAIRTLRNNIQVSDVDGNIIQIERSKPIHAIILVPELELFSNNDQEWLGHISTFEKKSGDFLHVLDTIELFRMMQAAHMISEKYYDVTPMMAFDLYLKKRAEAVAINRTIVFDMLFRPQ